MEAYVLGKIKSDGFRFLAKLYRFIWNEVEKTGSTELNFEDKGYLDYFCQKLNQFELLKRKKEQIIALVSGTVENTKRLFKREVFRMYFDEPKGQDTIDNYDRYYNDRMKFTGDGKELLIEKATLASEVRKLVKYYNYMFYREVCPQHIKDYVMDMIRAKNKAFEFLESELEKFKTMPAIVTQTIATYIPPKIRAKIFKWDEEDSDASKENGESSKKDDAVLTSPLAGEVAMRSLAGEGDSSKNEKDIPVINSPLTPTPLPQGERDSAFPLFGNDVNTINRHADENRHPNTGNEMDSDLRRSGETVTATPTGSDLIDYYLKKPTELIKMMSSAMDLPPSALLNEVQIPPSLEYDLDKSPDIVEVQTDKQSDILEHKEISIILKKTKDLIDESMSKGLTYNMLISHGIRLRLKQFTLKQRLKINHNYEVKQDTEGIG